ncbi:FtsX-like permease family protein [Paractinoplanes atraurantiacus]|uniref:Putative ABC transport system permease protein n=1 Tax=Paractinoplanes atraurantiacus TaxID=1036182 RepID=A0A285KA35_9ACTN|nr:FtsX-like permease family protein [Actinoplanes atraurantiacus]SNY69469.1 putative ABC transport system permease protein [Actinoplanes atraurantiacus]
MRPSLHWPSIRGRARADLAPLLLMAAVVIAVSLLAAVVPPLQRATEDDTFRDSVHATVRVHAPWDSNYAMGDGYQREPALAQYLAFLPRSAKEQLGPEQLAVLDPPVTTVTSGPLAFITGDAPRNLRLGFVRDDESDGPATTWVSGGPPRATAPGEVVVRPGTPWLVQIGLSEVSARTIGAAPGDQIKVKDEQGNRFHVRVSGVFRPVDAGDPGWRMAPWLLAPSGNSFGGLLSADSLPDARILLPADRLDRTVTFSPTTAKLDRDSARSLAAAVATLKATSAASGVRDDSLRWDSTLDTEVNEVQARITAATAQATVLLLAVLAGAALVLSLTAELLTRRRLTALTAYRERGGALPVLAAELTVESLAVAVPAAGIGVLLAYVVAGGAAVLWALPVALAAIVAGPALGTLAAARATRDRRVPANRSARLWLRRTSQLRRAAVDVAVLTAAAGALVALHQRGIGGDPVLPASAPVLGVLGGALLLLRLLPLATRGLLGVTLRGCRALPVFGAARAAASSARLLPGLALVTAVGLAAFALVLSATVTSGLADGAWRSVGADARFDIAPGGAGSAQEFAAAPGVKQVVAARITDVQVVADGLAFSPRLVVVDAAAYQRLLASTPLPDAPDLARLTGGGGGGAIPALVRTRDDSIRAGTTVNLRRDGTSALTLTAVGTAPAVGDATDVIVIDTATATAAGLDAAPTTVWALGPGAARAVREAGADGTAVVRADLLRDRAAAPLTSGLTRLAYASAAALLALAVLGFALGAAANAPARWETLARLRTLGLRARDTRRVAAGELLPLVLFAAICGPALGIVLARVTLGPLALNLLTAQAGNPVVATPWPVAVIAAAVLLAALTAVVTVEATLRRRHRLGEVLRAGGS